MLCFHGERIVFAENRVHPFILMNLELVMIRHAPIIFQSFGTRRLLVHACHRNVTNLQKLRSGEKMSYAPDNDRAS